ncbi:MAG: AAA family ATPase [Flavobacteriales bacterium]|nr:AAA family ATPase [Flavobacteriales bacterium]
MTIIGRKEEQAEMRSYLNDEKSHLIAVIGRRRVGKTFLIRETYKENKVFEMTGLKDAEVDKQLINFALQMNLFFPSEKLHDTPPDWLRAFNQLTQQLSQLDTTKKPVLFFDELPWIAGKKSGFTEALAHWWNNWASQQNIVVVICGSAASWMIENVVNAKGGLHNRLTKLITLLPFTLAETKAFFEHKNIQLSDYQIAQLYMAIGGIPHYLEQIEKGKSAAQNIQNICFSKDGVLRNEFDNLYPALFENATNHIAVIKALSDKSMGLERKELLKATGKSDGGYFSNVLKELEISGFITVYEPLEKKKKGSLYRLSDEYSLFYLRFIDGKKVDDNYWLNLSQSQEYKTWCGYAFENLCIKHVSNIQRALGISGVQTTVNSFLHKKNKDYEKGFQIDLLIDRKDGVITICEMKFYADEYTISSEYAASLRIKREGLKAVTKTNKTIHITFITTYGVSDNQHKLDLVDNDFKLEVLFL